MNRHQAKYELNKAFPNQVVTLRFYRKSVYCRESKYEVTLYVLCFRGRKTAKQVVIAEGRNLAQVVADAKLHTATDFAIQENKG